MKEQIIKITEIQFPNAQFLPEIVKLLDEGHTVTLQLRGFSMRPFLEDKRDKALLAKRAEYHVGEPVLAEINKRQYVLHRIIKIEGEQVTLKGDGNLCTESCNMQDVKAVAVGFYRKGRQTLDRIDGRKWRIYSSIWTALDPCRRYLLAFYRKIWIPLWGTV